VAKRLGLHGADEPLSLLRCLPRVAAARGECEEVGGLEEARVHVADTCAVVSVATARMSILLEGVALRHLCRWFRTELGKGGRYQFSSHIGCRKESTAEKTTNTACYTIILRLKRLWLLT
jgi:hypothetical protein